MKIRLLLDVPVESRHGLTSGREMDVIGTLPPSLEVRQVDMPRWWVMGDAGEKVGILRHEASEIPDEEGEDAEIPQAPR